MHKQSKLQIYEYKLNKYIRLKQLNNKLIGGYKKNSNKKHYNQNHMNKRYSLSVSEPWFTLISLGLKKVEGRKNKGAFKDMQIGDLVEWTNDDFLPRKVMTKIVNVKKYNTFAEYLETEGLENCLPGMPNLNHGLSVYFKYYTKKDEEEFGVSAIHLEIVEQN